MQISLQFFILYAYSSPIATSIFALLLLLLKNRNSPSAIREYPLTPLSRRNITPPALELHLFDLSAYNTDISKLDDLYIIPTEASPHRQPA